MTPNTITLAEAKRICRELGYTLRYSPEYEEYSVRPLGGGDAYFTPERGDAVDTCLFMATKRQGF
jgi:hypothetical protein